ncbi:hypothetical protein ABZ901_03520 [Actinacidiphila alni]|uniref:hypothetical protein n=1 Tax=Actinacidiphila alni TaxID=380248 RepID=UPI0033DE3D9C
MPNTGFSSTSAPSYGASRPPSTSSDVTEPAPCAPRLAAMPCAPKAVAQPDAPKTVAQPNAPKTVAQPNAYSGHMCRFRAPAAGRTSLPASRHLVSSTGQ